MVRYLLRAPPLTPLTPKTGSRGTVLGTRHLQRMEEMRTTAISIILSARYVRLLNSHSVLPDYYGCSRATARASASSRIFSRTSRGHVPAGAVASKVTLICSVRSIPASGAPLDTFADTPSFLGEWWLLPGKGSFSNFDQASVRRFGDAQKRYVRE